LDDIWAVIGLSSLIASVVTISLGLIRDIIVEGYRFRKQSEAGYLQNQIKLYSQIFFLLTRIRCDEFDPLFFKGTSEDVKEINELLKTNSSSLESIVVAHWLALMRSWSVGVAAKDEAERDRAREYASDRLRDINGTIAKILNSNLLPRYRKIVGKTVPDV
jgi:hypothetical protein